MGSNHAPVTEPWQSGRRLDDALYALADTVRALAVLLHPFVPASAERMLAAVGDTGGVAWDRAELGMLPAGATVRRPEPLFPKIER